MKSTRLIHMNVAELIISEEPLEISTVLGSCVSVCLYSPEQNIGGMNHFALPSEDYARARRDSTGRDLRDEMNFGTHAVPYLIEELCERTNNSYSILQAKIVGGAAVVEGLTNGTEIGERNVAVAREILKKYRIPIVGIDVGGMVGRKVHFYTATGRLRVAPLIEKTKQTTDLLGQKKRILIVDDSKTIRIFLRKIFNQDPGLEVVGEAEDALVAEAMLTKLRPDVMTLDVHMPKLDGVTFLEKLLPKNPMPVVMISSLNIEESGAILRALEIGAVDYIQKPKMNELELLGPTICERVKTAASVRVTKWRPKSNVWTGDTNLGTLCRSTIVAIGASTGGTEALKDVLLKLPKDIPPIVIVQHIPPVFSAAFASRLNELCPFEVKEAAKGDQLRPGLVLIAPGGKQMAVAPSSNGYEVRITDAPPVNRHKPSVDHLFDSVALHVGKRAIGVILTGMGNDGAKGLLKMRQAGARTIAQDKESSVVYGMPKIAFEVGAVDEVHSLNNIPGVLVKWLSEKKAA